MKIANIILGSYINGYSIIQELYENNVRDIYVLDVSKDVSAYSNKINGFYKIKNNEDSIFNVLKEISHKYDLLVLYPNQDIYVEHLCNLYPAIKDFCFIAFNPENAVLFQDKMVQYQFCKILDVPCPNVLGINNEDDLKKIYTLTMPVLIKPTKRDNLSSRVFRTLLLNTEKDFETHLEQLKNFVSEGVTFVASEVIPGDGSNIFAYTGYRSRTGDILGEWIGKKLAQFPDDFGVFSSASNQAPKLLIEQSRKLLNGMDLWGVNEPEYKFDHRDGQYKLMEINLRPMMWHRVGALSSVPLNYIQYLEATGEKIPRFDQDQTTNIHYVFLTYELINLLTRKGYYKIFKQNLFHGDKTVPAIWDCKDPFPFFFSFINVINKYKRNKKRDSHGH